MPSSKVHIVVGTGVSIALTCVFRLPYENVWIGMFASILPDVDTRKSWLGRWIPVWLFTKHRGVTHSLLGLFVISFLCFLCTNFYAAFLFFFGYLSHLILDSYTPMGVPWKWPKNKRSRR